MATTQVYTPTAGLTTTTFYRRVAESTFGGETCEEFSNVIQIDIWSSPVGASSFYQMLTCVSPILLMQLEEELSFYSIKTTIRQSGSSNLATSALITGDRTRHNNECGCSSFSPEIVIQTVDNPVISLTSTAFASSASSSTFCEGKSITFTASSTSAIATYTFLSWRNIPTS